MTHAVVIYGIVQWVIRVLGRSLISTRAGKPVLCAAMPIRLTIFTRSSLVSQRTSRLAADGGHGCRATLASPLFHQRMYDIEQFRR